MFDGSFCFMSAEGVADLQNLLMSVDTENCGEVTGEIADMSPELDVLVRNLCVASRFRTMRIELLSEIVVHLAKDMPLLVKELVARACMFECQNSAYMFLLYQLLKRSQLDIGDVVGVIERMYKRWKHRQIAVLLMFAWFAPEIEAARPEFYAVCMKCFEKKKRTGGLTHELDEFYDKLEVLRSNDWKQFKTYREVGYNPDPVCDVIRRDDMDAFLALTAQDGFDVHGRVAPSLFERCDILNHFPRPVHIAAFHGARQIFGYLVLNVEDLHWKDMAEMNVTNFAVAGGSYEIIRMLDDHQWNFKHSASIAALYHRQDVLDWMSQRPEPKKDVLGCLQSAASSNNVGSLLMLLNDIDSISDQLWTVLYVAVRDDSMDVVSFLLSHPAMRLNGSDSEGQTLAHIAARWNRDEILKLLVQSGQVDVNQRDKYQSTPLTIATELGHLEVVRVLLADPNLQPNLAVKEGSALHLSIMKNDLEMLKLLLTDTRFDVNLKNTQGFTPLHICSIRWRPAAAKVLCALPSVDVNMQDNCGETALSMSVNSRDTEMVTVLLSSPQVDTSTLDESGRKWLEELKKHAYT